MSSGLRVPYSPEHGPKIRENCMVPGTAVRMQIRPPVCIFPSHVDGYSMTVDGRYFSGDRRRQFQADWTAFQPNARSESSRVI